MNAPHINLAAVQEESELLFPIDLELRISDPELVRELQAQPENARDEYAVCALRIGILALKQARGQIDGETIKREGNRLVVELGKQLAVHANGLNNQLASVLKEYFDPRSGRFQERIERLVKKDGDLEEVLRRQIGDKDSELCKTLAAHFGIESPLMKQLSPTESEGLLKKLSKTLSEELANQRQRVLDEFSLDQPQSALSRLVKKLGDTHGDLSRNLQEKIDDVVSEFSLDKEDSALSRLTKQLHTASQAINEHLTLDKETSALFRLKRELLELLNTHSETNQKFQEEVKQTLAVFRAKREESERSTHGGKEFEQIVHEFIERDGQRAGDIVTFTGNTVGNIKNCKVGDTVIELGPEHVAAGAKIVVESKGDVSYSVRDACEEIDKARKNRDAGVGLVVFAKDKMDDGAEPLRRFKDDLIVIWDPEDPQTDIYLRAGLMVARALCARQVKQRQESTVDFVEIDKSILDIEKKAEHLDAIRTSADTIKSGAEKILEKVRLAKEGIDKQVSTLRERMADLKSSMAGP